MIPDKLYIDVIEDEDGYMFSESLQPNGGAIYIRKDKLLELLDEEISRYDNGYYLGVGMPDTFAKVAILKNVIAKINEI